MRLNATGMVLIGDTANTGMTVGLTISQGAATNEILCLKGSTIAHGVTTVAETDSFAIFTQFSGNFGGLTIQGISEGTTGWAVRAIHTTDVTTKSTAGTGAIHLNTALKSGTGVTDIGADVNEDLSTPQRSPQQRHLFGFIALDVHTAHVFVAQVQFQLDCTYGNNANRTVRKPQQDSTIDFSGEILRMGPEGAEAACPA